MAVNGTREIRVRRIDRLGWMTTFSDMVTLLLTFFVMIIAMSSMDRKSLEDAFGFFRSVAGPLYFPSRGSVDIRPGTVDQVPRIVEYSRESLRECIALELRKRSDKDAGRGLDLFDVVETPRGLAVRIGSDVMFEEGSSRLGPQGSKVLAAVSAALRPAGATISVEGHTDNKGPEDANRVLSLERAVAVTDYMVYSAGLSPSRFCVAGYGMLRPVATNDTDGGRRNNRRVEIILLKDRF